MWATNDTRASHSRKQSLGEGWRVNDKTGRSEGHWNQKPTYNLETYRTQEGHQYLQNCFSLVPAFPKECLAPKEVNSPETHLAHIIIITLLDTNLIFIPQFTKESRDQLFSWGLPLHLRI